MLIGGLFIFVLIMLNGIGAMSMKKYQRKIAIASWILSVIFMGLFYDTVDYGNYANKFTEMSKFNGDWEDLVSNNKEFLYALLNMLFSDMGFDYSSFRFASFAVALGIVYYVVYRIVGSTCGFTILYLIFPMVFDIIQVRNFYLEAFLTLAIYWCSRVKEKRKIIFVSMMLLASTFHLSAIIYLGWCIIDRLYESKKGRYIVYACVFAGICMPLYADLIFNSAANIALLLSGQDETSQKLATYTMNEFAFRYVSSWCQALIMLMVAYWLQVKIKAENMKDEFIGEVSQRLLTLVLYMCCLLPCFVLLADLDRFLRNLLPIMYALILFYAQRKPGIRWVIRFVILVMALGFGYVKFYHGLSELLPEMLNHHYMFDF